MNYPPNSGGYPYPPNMGPNMGGQSNIGFDLGAQPSGSPGYPLNPQAGGFPCPPGSQDSLLFSSGPSMNATQSTPYSLYPSGPAPPPSVSYQQPLNAQPPAAPYPNQSSPYPPQPSSCPAPYPPTSAGYPPQPNASPYPQTPAQTFYPQAQPPSQGYPYTPNQYQSTVTASSNPSLYGAAPTTPYSSSPLQSSSSCAAGTMWPYQERPTVKPAMSFDPSTDAAHLRKAMKGLGTDEAALIRVLGRRTSQQRQQIMLRYQQSYGRDLIKDLKKELSGQFEMAIIALLVPLHKYLVQELNYAISGVGTNEKTLIEILCSSDNYTLRSINGMYHSTYGRTLEADLRADTSGDFRKLMISMAAGNRDETWNDLSVVPGLAQSLYSSGVKKLGTDEAEFRRILSTYSYPILRCVFEEYKKVSGGKSFDAAIKSELSGNFRDGMFAIYECINNRAAFFAQCLREAMKGFGTNDRTLIRIIVTRSEIDMGNVKDEYRRRFGKRLEESITSETSGDYKKVLLALIQD